MDIDRGALMRAKYCLAGLCLVAAAAATPAYAQAKAEAGYPSRPIRLLVPISAGGGADISTRVVATRLTEVLGQQVVVDNRPGGSGNIAFETLANSAPN